MCWGSENISLSLKHWLIHFLHLQVIIRILDINDNPPVLTQHSYRATVEETVSLNAPLVQLRAEDPDQGENAHVRYSIVSGNNGGKQFYIVLIFFFFQLRTVLHIFFC